MEYIIGVGISIVVELVKKYIGTSPIGTMLAVLILSVIASVIYNAFLSAGIWDSVMPVLITAGAFHNFIIRQFGQTIK